MDRDECLRECAADMRCNAVNYTENECSLRNLNERSLAEPSEIMYTRDNYEAHIITGKVLVHTHVLYTPCVPFYL